jgi:hypothetical protein
MTSVSATFSPLYCSTSSVSDLDEVQYAPESSRTQQYQIDRRNDILKLKCLHNVHQANQIDQRNHFLKLKYLHNVHNANKKLHQKRLTYQQHAYHHSRLLAVAICPKLALNPLNPLPRGQA